MTAVIKVLIIDDNSDFRIISQATLEQYSPELDVETVSSGWDAVKQISAGIVDFVVLDIRMPRLNGFQTVRAIRKINQDIPVVMATAHTDRYTREQASTAGATALLTKPLDYPKLVKLIRDSHKARPKVLDQGARELLTAHFDRLKRLNVQKARLGINTPPEVLTEIEEIEREIASLQGASRD